MPVLTHTLEKLRWIPVLAALLFAMAAPSLWAQACADCHDQGKKLSASAHAPLACQDCHEQHEKFPHAAGVAKPVCGTCHAQQAGDHAKSVHGQAIKAGNAAAPDCSVCHGGAHELAQATTPVFKKAVPDTCGMCHSDIAAQYKESVHGAAVARGVQDAPVCTDCHGEHSILAPGNAASQVNARQIRGTCGRCHGDVRLARKFGLPPDRIVSFDASFHGLAARGGSQTVANCASCHGVHNILPSSDAKSTIHARNLPATCGKCHNGAGSRFALGTVHWVEGAQEPPLVRWTRLFYYLIIPATLAFMIMHHGGNWVRKLIALRFRAAVREAAAHKTHLPPEVRILPFERAQHALLVISFCALAWTGFALKYPDHWWARPLLGWEAAWPVRGIIHRVAAVVMVVVALIHVISLIVNRQLREHWKHLIPAAGDVVEAAQMFSYNVGVRSKIPCVSSHSYVEKIEYWAVIWGTLVMGFTGLLLWANRITLVWLPKSWLDAATAVHFYEAVLATLSILIWHFYTVIFDPDVYPMDPAWLTGVSVRKRSAHPPQPPAEPPQSELQETANHDRTELTAG